MPEILCVGLTTADLTYLGATAPRAGGKVEATSASVAVGGPAANAAIAAARMGSEVTLCSAVGAQPLARIARGELQDEGVNLLDAGVACQLPISSVFIDEDGDRSVVSVNGTENTTAVSPELVETAENAKVVLVDGHYPALALAALEAARNADVTTVIDLGSWKAALPSLLPHCNIAIASADFTVPEGDVFDTVMSFGVSLVAVSHGARPIVWRSRDGSTDTIDVPTIEPKATNGAGDILHGAFAHFLACGVSLVDALTKAAELASASCTDTSARIPADVVAQLPGGIS